MGWPPLRAHGWARREVLAKRVIPCLDVHAGRVVKGVQFVDLVDAGDPVGLAAFYDYGPYGTTLRRTIRQHPGQVTLLAVGPDGRISPLKTISLGTA